MGNSDLTVIIPVFNARPHLAGLVEQVAALDLACQILLVDDGSTDGSGAEIERLARTFPQVTALHQDGNRGAGHARNLAWPLATGRYTIFFDADDRLHAPAVTEGIRLLDAAPDISAAVFAYRLELEAGSDFSGMFPRDQGVFGSVLQGRHTATGSLETMAGLLQFTNFPWNKILRTAHYRQTGLRFGGTRVHNDILAHWHVLLFARRLLVVDEVICTHVVHPDGPNLTNIVDVRRLQMFDALEEVHDLLASHPAQRSRYAQHFWLFAYDLIDWARTLITPEARPEFERRVTRLLRRLDQEDFTLQACIRASISHPSPPPDWAEPGPFNRYPPA